ncbi:S8 family serine peptidase [Radiobacillus deserti]|uniref:S8 family serine peptidase n=1 Tax=Radiobacillus deserti TaxID=2594883 RepID=A0A516KJP3_9BACI|nr:S8 family serine peptidase [Radiobacillus deserti]QDP41589.1 S8 family serine peptidase [Radiobacillus deserti]
MKISQRILSYATIVLMVLSPQLVFAETGSDITKKSQDVSSSASRPSIAEKKREILQGEPVAEQDVKDREILLKVKDGQSFDSQTLGLLDREVSETMKKNGFQLVQVPEGMDYKRTLEQLNKQSSIALAEPNYERQVEATISDPFYNQQWHLPRIQLPTAWDTTKGSTNVTIAVLDTGVNASHEDLAGRILPGYDFVNTDSNPADDNGHGTMVSGIIAANSNSIGVAGVDQNAKILPVKVAGSDGKLSVYDTTDGIYYAMEQGADIINMSYGSYQDSTLEETAIWDAYEAGIVLIASAGNDDKSDWSYPASYAPVISVAATDQADNAASFSNYGYMVDITAPGTSIASTHYNGAYAAGDGTSFSAPIVSGIAGLLLAKHPDWTPLQVEWALEASADSLDGSEWNGFDGFGLVNANQALQQTLPSLANDASDRMSGAKRLTNQLATTEQFETPLDQDWFTFTVNQPSTISIQISNAAPHIDFVAALERYSDSTLTDSIDLDDTSEGMDEYMQVEVAAGTYYLRVEDYYLHWSNQPYEVLLHVENQNAVSVFSDVTLYQTEIEYLAEHGIIKGYSDGTFKPRNNVTRLQAVQMILNQLGIDPETTPAPNPGFTDVNESSYGYKAVAVAYDMGIIKGKGDVFDRGGSLTRSQMAAILVNTYDLVGNGTTYFTDVPKTAASYPAIDAIISNQIARGYSDQTFKPNDKITRQHFSVFLYNYLTK